MKRRGRAVVVVVLVRRGALGAGVHAQRAGRRAGVVAVGVGVAAMMLDGVTGGSVTGICAALVVV